MKKSFSEKLLCILDDIGYEMVGEIGAEEASKAIIELVKEIIPSEQATDSSWADPGNTIRRQGWNACRSEILKKLEQEVC